MPSIIYEKQSLDIKKIIPSVKFSLSNVKGAMKDWKSLGKWQYDNLLKGRDELPQYTIDEVTELTKNASTTVEKAKIIYNYVQNKTRYVSIQLGIGGWQPMLAINPTVIKIDFFTLHILYPYA